MGLIMVRKETHTEGVAQDERVEGDMDCSRISSAAFEKDVLLLDDSGNIGHIDTAVRTARNDEFIPSVIQSPQT
jgi:hypothetical protein